MNQSESARCACHEADQTPEHVLLTRLTAHCGSANELKRTVKFIEDVGINV
jgi:hypothetical protein